MKALIFAIIGLSLLIGSPAQAQQSIPVTVQALPPNPVTVSRLYTQVSNRLIWTTCINFTNATSKLMTAIQFKFTYLDAFNTPLTTFRADRVGEFMPGVLIEGPENGQISGGGNVDQKIQNCWQVAQVVGSLSAVTAEVSKVRYNDGTISVAPAGAVPIYTGRYMSGGNGFVDPPKEISCRGIVFGQRMKWWWIEQNGHGNKKIEPCIVEWEKEHGNLENWPPAERAPGPSPSPQ